MTEIARFAGDSDYFDVHNWMQKADLQPLDGANSNHSTVGETVIQARRMIWTVRYRRPRHLLHVCSFPTRIQALTELFLSALREKDLVVDGIFLVDGAPRLQAASQRRGLRF